MVVAAILGLSCSKSHGPLPAPSQVQMMNRPLPYVEKPKEYGPLDALVGSGAGLRLAFVKMPHPEDLLEGYYYWSPPGDVSLDPRLRGTRTDVALKCDRSASSPRNRPACGTPEGKRITVGTRVFCFDPEEKTGPKGLPAFYGAFIAWSGIGDCSMQFNLGLVRDEQHKKAALAAAVTAADWMDSFRPGEQRPAAPLLAANRVIIDAAEQALDRRRR